MLEVNKHAELKKINAKHQREIAEKRIQDAINALHRGLETAEDYLEKFVEAPSDFERTKILNYVINHLVCNIQPNLRIDLLADSQAELAKLEVANA